MSEKKKTISEKTNELQKLLDWFDSDDFELEQAVNKFREAKSLADDIVGGLDELKNEIDIVQKDFSDSSSG